jgi:ligand-binding SRPBCC domain-containing protein
MQNQSIVSSTFWQSPTRILESKAIVPATLEEVFAFFSKAENLERLTPTSLRFQILSSLPIEMKVGTIIEYRLRLMGIPFRWQSVITAWEPLLLFADDQKRGPYKLWHHEHRFATTESGTEIIDRVEYKIIGGFIEPFVHALFVGPQLKKIFSFREKVIREVFGQSYSS